MNRHQIESVMVKGRLDPADFFGCPHCGRPQCKGHAVIVARTVLSAEDLVYWTNRARELAPGEEVQIIPLGLSA